MTSAQQDVCANGNSNKNKLTICLMTVKGYHFLQRTAQKYKNIFRLIVVGNDKSIQKDYEEDIIELCNAQQIPFIKRTDFKTVDTEYCLAISWRWLINHPTNKLIVFHDSLLPKYRGFAPLVNALINGEEEVGVTAVFGAEEFDRGDIIAQSKSKITYPIKINDAIELIVHNYLEVATVVLDNLQKGIPLLSRPQKEDDASYSIWRDELDYLIDWNKSAAEIKRFIDSVGYPYKGAYTELGNSVVRILDAAEVKDVVVENRHCGKVLFVENGKPIVICGKGLLKINEGYFEDGENPKPLIPVTKFRLRFSN